MYITVGPIAKSQLAAEKKFISTVQGDVVEVQQASPGIYYITYKERKVKSPARKNGNRPKGRFGLFGA